MPNDLPPWYTVYQQPQRWIKAGVFEAIVHDLRALLRIACGRNEQPSAVILDSRTLQSSPESGGRAGYDGTKRRKGSKVRAAVDTLGHLLALRVTAANEQGRAQVGQLAEKVQEATGQSVELAYVDQGYTGEQPAQDAAARGLQLEVIKLPEAKKGFVLLPRRWVVERSFGWAARFRRLARDYERLPASVSGLHFLAFVIIMLKNVVWRRTLMEQAYIGRSVNSEQVNTAHLEEEFIVSINWLLIAVSGAATVFLLPGTGFQWPPFLVFLSVFLQICVAQHYVRRRLRLAKAILLVGLALSYTVALKVIGGPAMPFLSVAVVIANAIVSPRLGLVNAALCSIVLAAFVPTREMLYPALALVWLSVAMLLLSSRGLHTVLDWAWSSEQQASKLLEELRERQGRLNQTVTALTEATRRLQRTSHELAKARLRADEARQMKERFAANISHELRTPLSLILGFSTMMHLSPEVYGEFDWPSTLRRDVRQIYESSRLLLDLINDVLDLSLVDAMQMPVRKERSDLACVISEAVGAARELLANRGIELRVVLPAEMPQFDFDRTRIRQVLLNLLNNAARFTEEGSITVTAEVSQREVVVSVVDTGSGISPEELSRVFDEFHQVDMSLRRTRTGTGLGLAISKRFVELHGGRIWAESEVGRGSTFHFSLPLSHQGVLSPLIASQAPKPETKPEAETIIVVDRDPLVGEVLSRYLEGYHVVRTPELTEARTLVAQWHPRALLLNVPPGSEPTEALQQDAMDTLPAKVPVLFFSLPSQSWLAAEAGVCGCLSKPIDPDQLLEAIREIDGAREVLVVDDDWGFVQLVRRILEKADCKYNLRAAYDGAEALKLIEEKRPDVILLDLVMPGMDGFATLDALRARDSKLMIPVLLVTATSYGQDRFAQRSSGVNLVRRLALSPVETARCLQALLDVTEPDYAYDTGIERSAVGPA